MSHLRILFGSDEHDFQLILKQFKSNFVTYQLSPDVCTINDFSEFVYTRGDHEGTLKIEHGDTSIKPKLTLKRFGGSFGTLIFDEKSLSCIILGFTVYWVF